MLIRNIPTITGAARGRQIGTPTINLDASKAPKSLRHGIYACRITIDGKRMKGAMHYGPRPVFNDDVALEVHVLDEVIEMLPRMVDLEIVLKIRDVKDFPTVRELQAAIASDISAVRGILGAA